LLINCVKVYLETIPEIIEKHDFSGMAAQKSLKKMRKNGGCRA
jgi:hypothetical protein